MTTQSKRDTQIDVLKGILIIPMIVSHISEVWAVSIGNATNSLITLVAFSGFMFCFGFVAQIAYFSKPDLDFRRILPTIYRPLLAFYVCAMFVAIFFKGHALTLREYFQILILSRIPAYTEFLPAFSLVILVSVLFIKPLRWVLATPIRFLIVCLLLLLTTFIPNEWVKFPQIALFVGGPMSLMSSFPILQYFIFFLGGLYISYHHLGDSRILKGIAVLGSILFLIATKVFGFPVRFPPSIGWIAEGIPLVLLAYGVAGFIDKVGLLQRILVPIGENTLVYLVLSDVMIFGLRSVMRDNVTLIQSLLLIILMMAAIYYIVTITRRTKS